MRGRTNAAVGGVQLPELSNPAGAANIQSGYQAINGEGEVVTGTYDPEAAVTSWTQNVQIEFGTYTNTKQTVTLSGDAASVCAFGTINGHFSGGFFCTSQSSSGTLLYDWSGAAHQVRIRITAQLGSDRRTLTLTLDSRGGSGNATITLNCTGWR